MNKDMTFEKNRVGRLIDEGLKNGAKFVSLWDGEEWSVKRDPTGDLVKKEMCASDMESLKFRDADGNSLGNFRIAWGEGRDNVYDHTDNSWCNTLWNKANLGR